MLTRMDTFRPHDMKHYHRMESVHASALFHVNRLEHLLWP